MLSTKQKLLNCVFTRQLVFPDPVSVCSWLAELQLAGRGTVDRLVYGKYYIGICMVVSQLLVNFIPDHATKH